MPKIAVLFVLSFVLGACHPLYVLPEPPPAAERKNVSLIPSPENDDEEQKYLAVRAQVLKIYQLLADLQLEAASEFFSQETRDFLLYGGAENSSVGEVLASGKLTMKNGGVVEFEPVSMLLASDVSKLVDTVEGCLLYTSPSPRD